MTNKFLGNVASKILASFHPYLGYFTLIAEIIFRATEADHPHPSLLKVVQLPTAVVVKCRTH